MKAASTTMAIIIRSKKVKITRRQLRRIIRETLESEINPYGTGSEPVYDEDEQSELVGHT